MADVLVVLPPSETKAVGGDGPPLDLDRLGWPELHAVRERLCRSVVRAASVSTKRAMATFELGPSQEAELEHDRRLRESPTAPAIERYDGVLYDSLDVRSLTAAQRRRADERLVVASALFGLVRATDPIPAYRLSAGTKLPRVGGLAPIWKPRLGGLLGRLADDQLVVDLRSGAYRALAPLPRALDVRVLSERPDGSRTVVSHANKSTKGRIARVLAAATRAPEDVDDVAALVRADGWSVEVPDERRLNVVVPA